VSAFGTTYAQVLPGMLLVGFGAGLLMPTATNSVVGSVPRGDAGVGSASNGVAIQVGGALGVGVLGSALSTRYQAHLTGVLSGHSVAPAASHAIATRLRAEGFVASPRGLVAYPHRQPASHARADARG